MLVLTLYYHQRNPLFILSYNTNQAITFFPELAQLLENVGKMIFRFLTQRTRAKMARTGMLPLLLFRNPSSIYQMNRTGDNKLLHSCFLPNPEVRACSTACSVYGDLKVPSRPCKRLQLGQEPKRRKESMWTLGSSLLPSSIPQLSLCPLSLQPSPFLCPVPLQYLSCSLFCFPNGSALAVLKGWEMNSRLCTGYTHASLLEPFAWLSSSSFQMHMNRGDFDAWAQNHKASE